MVRRTATINPVSRCVGRDRRDRSRGRLARFGDRRRPCAGRIVAGGWRRRCVRPVGCGRRTGRRGRARRGDRGRLLDLARLQPARPVERDRQADPGDEYDRGEGADLLAGYPSRRPPIGYRGGRGGRRRIGNAVEPAHRRRDRRIARGGTRRGWVGQQAGEIFVVGHSTPPKVGPARTGAARARMAGNGHRSIYNGNLCAV